MAASGLDDVDVALLDELQRDASRTNVELARAVGLSPAAVLHRVRRLKETGVVRSITARLDPAKVGLPLQAFVLVTLARADERASRALEEELARLPQVVRADWVAGETDVVVQLVARDVPDLQRALVRLSNKGGQRVITLLRTDEAKPPTPLTLPEASRRRRRPRSP